MNRRKELKNRNRVQNKKKREREEEKEKQRKKKRSQKIPPSLPPQKRREDTKQKEKIKEKMRKKEEEHTNCYLHHLTSSRKVKMNSQSFPLSPSSFYLLTSMENIFIIIFIYSCIPDFVFIHSFIHLIFSFIHSFIVGEEEFTPS